MYRSNLLLSSSGLHCQRERLENRLQPFSCSDPIVEETVITTRNVFNMQVLQLFRGACLKEENLERDYNRSKYLGWMQFGVATRADTTDV